MSAGKAVLSVWKVLPPVWSKHESFDVKEAEEEQDRLRSEWEKHRLSLEIPADEEWEREGLQL